MPTAVYTQTGGNGLPDISYVKDDNGDITLRIEETGANFLKIVNGGGHWEIQSLGSIAPNYLEIEGGYVKVHQMS